MYDDGSTRIGDVHVLAIDGARQARPQRTSR
jgi:hypothetical protein